MTNINQIFETLASDNGRLFKIDYLTKHKDNKVLQEVIHLALDPYIQFFIRKIPRYEPAQPNAKVADLFTVLPYLYDFASRKVTGNAAITALQNILMSVSADDAKVIERIIEKDLR